MYKTMYEIVCSTKKKKKKRVEYNGLLTHFICGVNMIVSMFTWAHGPEPWVWVWVQCHGYAVRIRVLHVKKSQVQVRDHGYCNKLSYPDKYGYGYG